MKTLVIGNSVALFVASALFANAASKFIEPDAVRGTSRAVVADKVPLAHTAQIFPLGKDGKIVDKENPAKQIERVLTNLGEVLRAANSRLEKVVKINVVVVDEKLVAEVEKAFAKQFKNSGPAVSFVVGALPLPDALVAMDAVAECKTSRLGKQRSIKQMDVIEDGLAFAQVIRLPAGGAFYISGQAKLGELGVATTKTMESLMETLKHLGASKSDIVQIKCFIQPAADAPIAKKQISRFFEGKAVPPLVFVDWISPKLPIEIEMIVAAPENRDAKEVISYLTPPGFQPSNVYSKVARVNYGRLVYISGLYGSTPGNAEKQVLEIFDSLKRIVSKSGSDFGSLAKATYYVSDAAGNNKLNELRPKYYDPKRPPAASKALVKGVGREKQSVTFDMIAGTIE